MLGDDVLGAVGEGQQVAHGDEGVVEGLDGRDPLVRVQREHLLQQVDALPAVRLLRLHVRPVQVGHVHLQHVAEGGGDLKYEHCPKYQLLPSLLTLYLITNLLHYITLSHFCD